MVRELDLSRITLRLVEKTDKKGGDNDEHVISKLSGELLPVLQRSLVRVSLGCSFDLLTMFSILRAN